MSLATCPWEPEGLSTGRAEMDRQMGGAIPWGSLTLIEGKHATGKSVLCQHLTYSALQSDSGVAFYTSETGSPSLISQMGSLGLDVMDHFLLDKLRIFPLELPDQRSEAANHLGMLLRHIADLPQEFEFVVVDSLTPLLPHCPSDALAEFFAGCRQICREGKTIALTLDPRLLVTSVGDQIPFWCDVHLRLRLETVTVERVVRAMDVFKPVHQGEGHSPKINFDVHPGQGMTIIWPKPTPR